MPEITAVSFVSACPGSDKLHFCCVQLSLIRCPLPQWTSDSPSAEFLCVSWSHSFPSFVASSLQKWKCCPHPTVPISLSRPAGGCFLNSWNILVLIKGMETCPPLPISLWWPLPSFQSFHEALRYRCPLGCPKMQQKAHREV